MRIGVRRMTCLKSRKIQKIVNFKSSSFVNFELKTGHKSYAMTLAVKGKPGQLMFTYSLESGFHIEDEISAQVL